MSVDRTPEEEQSIRAAFAAKYDKKWESILIAGQAALDKNDPRKKEES